MVTGRAGAQPVGAGLCLPLPQGLLPPGREHLAPHPSDARPLVGSGHQGGGVSWCGGWGGEQDPSGGWNVPGRRVGGGVGDGGSAGGGGGGVAPGGVGGDASGWCGGPWGGSGGGHGRGGVDGAGGGGGCRGGGRGGVAGSSAVPATHALRVPLVPHLPLVLVHGL